MSNSLEGMVELYIIQSDITTARGMRAVRVLPIQLWEFLGREPVLDDLNLETARAWLEWRSSQVGICSLREDAKKLLTIWRWLAAGGLVEETFATPKHLLPLRLGGHRPEPCKPRQESEAPSRSLLQRLFSQD